MFTSKKHVKLSSMTIVICFSFKHHHQPIVQVTPWKFVLLPRMKIFFQLKAVFLTLKFTMLLSNSSVNFLVFQFAQVSLKQFVIRSLIVLLSVHGSSQLFLKIPHHPFKFSSPDRSHRHSISKHFFHDIFFVLIKCFVVPSK